MFNKCSIEPDRKEKSAIIFLYLNLFFLYMLCIFYVHARLDITLFITCRNKIRNYFATRMTKINQNDKKLNCKGSMCQKRQKVLHKKWSWKWSFLPIAIFVQFRGQIFNESSSSQWEQMVPLYMMIYFFTPTTQTYWRQNNHRN